VRLLVSTYHLISTRSSCYNSATAALHDGYQAAWNATAADILNAVQKGIETYGARKVLVTGHSIGGTIALLDGLFLTHKLPPSIAVETVTFGQPRVGNSDFASFVDETVSLARNSSPIHRSHALTSLIARKIQWYINADNEQAGSCPSFPAYITRISTLIK
jgi:predicted lipase